MRPKLEYLSRGAAVAELQAKLNTLMPEAQPPLAVDALFGDHTLARVKRFQKSRGLVADGVVGQKTWAAIDGLAPPIAVGPEPGPPPRHPANPPLTYHGKGVKVYSGTPIRCSFGTAYSSLIIPSAQPATVGDCQAFVNILPFGQCRSRDHPGYVDEDFEDPTLDVYFHYQSKPGFKPACTPWIGEPWTGHFTAYGPVDDAQEIDKTARCTCRYGGIIRFV